MIDVILGEKADEGGGVRMLVTVGDSVFPCQFDAGNMAKSDSQSCCSGSTLRPEMVCWVAEER